MTNDMTQNSTTDTAYTPRLVQLELHGYKTFADKTQFVFTGGITAIVGPNGSGKSNIADAIRWVLGEQSYSVLRGKRTEDMIFAGSELRPRMGMATVSVTFDNTDGWLPVDYTTVVLTRRAHRSGENEYYLNGTRVRLRDIQELLATSGLGKRSYTVIGQGLIDQALSLRPEERRTLIEEAAGISAYKRKRDQALNRLAEVENNLVRVQDILAEITPRLRRLERQAARAREYQLLEKELKAHLLTWYGYRWHQALEELAQAKTARSQQEERVAHHKARVQELEETLESLREEYTNLREVLKKYHADIAQVHAELERLLREEAVVQERQRGLEAQRETLLSELPGIEAHIHVLEERLADMRQQEQALQEEERTLLQLLEKLRAEQQTIEERRAQAHARLQEIHNRVLTLTGRQVQLATDMERMSERIEQLQEEIRTRRGRETTLKEEVENLRRQLQQLREKRKVREEHLRRLEQQIQDTSQELERVRSHLDRAQEDVRRIQEDIRHMQERLELLNRLREEGAGLYAGVRAVMRAHLPGIVGIVGELLHVPSQYERAIEEALGASLQDVVVKRWEDAERAIAFLKRERAGRATFLPLDTLRPPRRIGIPKDAGVIGLAADLVKAKGELAPVVELLLNRTLVVEDLKTARRVLPRAGGMRIVTLAGELVRSSGRVTGGEGKHTRGGVLSRERERRELPNRLKEAEHALDEAKARVRNLQEALQKAKAKQNALQKEKEALVRELSQLQNEERRLEQEVSRAESRVHAEQTLIAHMEEELTTLQERLVQAQEEHARVTEALAQAKAEEQRAQEVLAAIDDRDVREAFTRTESQHAALVERRLTLQQTRQTLEEDLERQRTLLRTRRERLEHLQDELAHLQETLARIRQQLEAQRKRLQALEEPASQTEAQLRSLEEKRQALSQELERERRRLHEAESLLGRLTLAVQRAEDTLKRLHEEIEHDFGLVQVEGEPAYPTQSPLPFGNGVISLPKVTQIPETLEEEIKRLRVRLRQLGTINPNAPQEYEELKARHDFLESQIADLKEASADLKKALEELEQIMQREFKRTFQAVARKFREYFERLFGGGNARLVLTQPDDFQSTGIEIIARPPGKRTQSLSMLSGGERALTAAALIFAILDVSPPPFCILDEVDAALDEANVGRFRDTLKELSRKIQFIVITHNRYTIEAADTIYGISMGKDGVSRTLSLKLESLRKAA